MSKYLPISEISAVLLDSQKLFTDSISRTFKQSGLFKKIVAFNEQSSISTFLKKNTPAIIYSFYRLFLEWQ